MPLFVAALLGGLVNIAATVAGRVLIALGIGAVTYTGVSTSLGFLKSSALAAFAGLPSQTLGLLSYMKVGESISIIFSAILVRAALAGLSAGGSISKLVKQ